MKKIKKIEESWKVNFLNSVLVKNKKLDFDLAKSLFRGSGNIPESLSELRLGVRSFGNNIQDSSDYMSIICKFLEVVGIEISKDKIDKSIEDGVKIEDVVRRVVLIYKSLFYANEKFSVLDPFSNNYGDLDFFMKIENGINSDNLGTLFNNANEVHNQYIKLPTNYNKDKFVNELFKRIETTNDSLYITGKAGTGKSTFIQYYTKMTKKKIIVLSFTGIAAVNIGGQTIHSFCGFPFRPMLPKDEGVKKLQPHFNTYKIIQNLDTIIIDEVSMLRSDILEGMDHFFRINGGDKSKFFGGKQVLFVGDPYQLPPVVENDIVSNELFNDVYESEYFFDAPVFKKMSPEKIEFQKIHRQKNIEFINLLNKVRDYSIINTEINLINNKCTEISKFSEDDMEIRLTTNKYIAKEENRRRLDIINEKEYVYEAEIFNRFSKDKYPVPQYLHLKRGSQIMFVKNDCQNNIRQWVNGTIAEIDFLTDEVIEVKMKDGSIHKIEKVTWENRKYKYNKLERRIESEVVGSFRHFPVKLAWAITIHKSQGLTFDNVKVDLGSRTFAPGQLYVALSRCKSLKGLTLVRKINNNDIIIDKRIQKFEKNYCNQVKTTSYRNNAHNKNIILQ